MKKEVSSPKRNTVQKESSSLCTVHEYELTIKYGSQRLLDCIKNAVKLTVSK